MPYRSTETNRMRRTIRTTQTGSGESWSRQTESSNSFGRASSASAARCIFSGVPPIWPSPVSPGGELPSIPAAFPTYQTEWRGRHTRMKSVAAGFGPAAARFLIPPSIPTPIPSLMVLRKHQSNRARRFILRIFTNSSFPTTPSASRDRRIRRFSTFYRQHMRRQRTWLGGKARRAKNRSLGSAQDRLGGGVLNQYVGARRLSATKHMSLFQQPARVLFLPSVLPGRRRGNCNPIRYRTKKELWPFFLLTPPWITHPLSTMPNYHENRLKPRARRYKPRSHSFCPQRIL